ncbi:Nucleoside-diphosphate-sugar epimerase [Flavisolibacter ginsengisoli DSM 18119]|uniref:Nucleoside-diphosphate-sugar epimerase n=2 Tax=Flavisolibacter TaxID=398041 RepID=A0A1M5C1B7_9BACT|nr:Nucleoside-diphosphate-sugar epimerase [Flavisolibacter ginsengisoli DSM 18119]
MISFKPVNQNVMQTIIGSGGTIGLPLAKELNKYTNQLKLVSRHPQKVNESDDLYPLDVQQFNKIDRAISGSEVVYITIGFDYSFKVWQKVWPPFLKAVIDACKLHGSRLVFFDNVYMYAKSAIPHMTEAAPLDPPSKKGMIRKQLHEMITNEVMQGNLQAIIARSADFYGPDTSKSMLAETAAKNLLKGKKAMVFGNPDKIHTYTFTPDAARATALLGNTADAYNQVWHLPTTKEPLTNRQWIELIANELQVAPRLQKIPTGMLSILGLFTPELKEFPEMMYQNEIDYVFDSSKFENKFGIYATTPREGIKIMMDYLKTIQP